MELQTAFLILLALLQLGDALTTFYILKEKRGRELNPVMDFLFDKFGIVPSLIVMKTAVVIAFWYAGIWWATAIMSLVYAWVVWHNWRQINK